MVRSPPACVQVAGVSQNKGTDRCVLVSCKPQRLGNKCPVADKDLTLENYDLDDWGPKQTYDYHGREGLFQFITFTQVEKKSAFHTVSVTHFSLFTSR